MTQGSESLFSHTNRAAENRAFMQKRHAELKRQKAEEDATRGNSTTPRSRSQADLLEPP